jgi:SAM-dependent methyltransferase
LILKELRKMSITGIDAWLDTAQGRYVMAWEQDKVDAVVADLFGYNAIQLGLPQYDLLAQNRIPLRQVAGESGQVDVFCDLRELPFAANSIDLVVMPHILEFHDDPHQILREVERILIPDGQLVITGFNPISLWGLRQRLPNRPDEFPVNGNYISVLRLKDWLQLLSFEVERGNFGCYAPPCHHERWIKRWHFMEAAGDRWWGLAGGVYLLRAVKRVHGMRLILPPWNPKSVPGKALTAITQKEIEQHGR